MSHSARRCSATPTFAPGRAERAAAVARVVLVAASLLAVPSDGARGGAASVAADPAARAGADSKEENAPAKPLARPTKVPRLSAAPAGSLVITQPAAGTVVSPGQAVRVTVEGRLGYAPSMMMMTLGEDSVLLKAPPFSATLHVHIEQTLSVPVGAMARDNDGRLAVAPVLDLRVVQTAALRAIELENHTLYLDSAGDGATGRILVTGTFSDGVRRDVTHGAMGTKYTSQRPQIATVDADGKVTAHAPGIAAIDVENERLFVQATVDVEATSPRR